MRQIAALLWRKVKDDRLDRFGFRFWTDGVWSAPASRALDFRLVNIGALDDAAAALDRPCIYDSVSYYGYQLLCRHRYDAFDDDERALVKALVELSDVRRLQLLLKRKRRLPRSRVEPRDLLLLN